MNLKGCYECAAWSQGKNILTHFSSLASLLPPTNGKKYPCESCSQRPSIWNHLEPHPGSDLGDTPGVLYKSKAMISEAASLPRSCAKEGSITDEGKLWDIQEQLVLLTLQ